MEHLLRVETVDVEQGQEDAVVVDTVRVDPEPDTRGDAGEDLHHHGQAIAFVPRVVAELAQDSTIERGVGP